MFKLAHLSDPHLGPLPAALVAELLSKRLSGFLSWHLNRRRIHDMKSLQQLLDDIKAHRPDHIALTGDLINIALPGEYENALTWLTRIEQGLASGADTGHGWVMDHQNTEETALARVNQELMQRLDLFTTEPAGGDANAGRLG